MKLLRMAATCAALAVSATAWAADTKHIMAFGDSLTWGWKPVAKGYPTDRYAFQDRWPGAMQAKLGAGYTVVEEGLSARTTDAADTVIPIKLGGAAYDGSAYLPDALASHEPLDVVIIMLGTNDLKIYFNRTPERIAEGADKLVQIAKNIKGGVATIYQSPKVLLVAPPVIGTNMQVFKDSFKGGLEKSQQLAKLYKDVAAKEGVEFFDAGSVIKTDGVDGLHLSADAERKLGDALADKVKTMTASQ